MSFDYFIYQPFSRSTRENHCSHYSCICLCERRKTFKLKKNNIIFFCNLVHTELLWGLGVHNFNSFSFLCSFWVSVHFYKFYPFLQYLFSSTGATQVPMKKGHTSRTAIWHSDTCCVLDLHYTFFYSYHESLGILCIFL